MKRRRLAGPFFGSLQRRSVRMKIRAESVTAVAATFTALAALAIAVWDNVQAREHNRLSVAPRLTIDMTQQNSTTSITVRNDGVGPALVRRMDVRFSDPGGVIESQTWPEVAARFSEAGHPVGATWQFTAGDAIGVDRGFTLFCVSAGEGPAAGPSVGDLIARLGVRIEYESIYGDSWSSTYNWTDRKDER
jgi:hypothetical protein